MLPSSRTVTERLVVSFLAQSAISALASLSLKPLTIAAASHPGRRGEYHGRRHQHFFKRFGARLGRDHYLLPPVSAAFRAFRIDFERRLAAPVSPLIQACNTCL